MGPSVVTSGSPLDLEGWDDSSLLLWGGVNVQLPPTHPLDLMGVDCHYSVVGGCVWVKETISPQSSSLDFVFLIYSRSHSIVSWIL